jgi:archaemetzincin
MTAGVVARTSAVPVIAVVPIGPVDAGLIAMLIPRLRDAYRAEVVEAPSLSLPERAWNSRRGQHRTATLLDELARARRNEWERLLGICDVDLYNPQLNFVFGEAAPARRVAVFSLWRLHPAETGVEARLLFERRATIEAIHELAHTYELGHCNDPRCVMWFSNTLAESDQKDAAFCPMHAAALSLTRRR